MPLTVKTDKNSYKFDGPHVSADGLKGTSGAYVITTKKKDGSHKVIDAGESHNVHERVANHDRATKWPAHEQDGIYMSGYYCDELNRMTIESEVRDHFNPPCGDR